MANKPMAGAHDMIGSKVGNQSKNEVKADQGGGSAASAAGTRTSLGKAAAELRRQHPIAHDNLGPHHGGREHVTHAPGIRANPGHPWAKGS